MKLDNNSAIPLYYQLRQIIRNKIINNEWVNGDEIPTELELCKQYNLSRSTVKQALSALVNEGLLIRQKGKGTFVTRKRVSDNLLKDPSLFKQILEQGLKPSTTLISAKYEMPDERTSNLLNIEPNNNICVIKRIRLANDEPLVLEWNYIVPKWDGELLEKINYDKDIAIYDYIEKTNNIKLSFFKTTAYPVFLDKYEKKLLQIDHTPPGLIIETLSYCDDTPIMLNKRLFRGDSCSIYLEHSVKDGQYGILSSGVSVDDKLASI